MEMTLNVFYDQFEPIEGYYAIWQHIEKRLEDYQVTALGLSSPYVQCLNTGTAYYTVNGGWAKYPDWFEDAKDEETSVLFMFELPSIHE